jgi:NitT/TauT family transport system substrate-binding protein
MTEDAMDDRKPPWSRRRFLGSVTGAATVGLVGRPPEPDAAEPPPETATLTVGRYESVCIAPTAVAEELLRAEGFTDVKYVSGDYPWGGVNLEMAFSGPTIMHIEAGDPISMIAGIHVGCFELLGTERVRSVRDLKGKRVAVRSLGGGHHTFISAMAAHVGVNPTRDINWVILPPAEAKLQLADGKVDAYLGFPPDPQELRAKNVGHVIVNSNVDRPWSQYFCCTLNANREFVKRQPVATKRALRAILKATDLCASDPERVADLLIAKGYTTQRHYALQALKAIPFNRWRAYDPEDTVRFYALRLHEAGMIKSSPQKIIALGTDWRSLNELKKELKG